MALGGPRLGGYSCKRAEPRVVVFSNYRCWCNNISPSNEEISVQSSVREFDSTVENMSVSTELPMIFPQQQRSSLPIPSHSTGEIS